jgi:hypothetical protein
VVVVRMVNLMAVGCSMTQSIAGGIGDVGDFGMDEEKETS